VTLSVAVTSAPFLTMNVTMSALPLSQATMSGVRDACVKSTDGTNFCRLGRDNGAPRGKPDRISLFYALDVASSFDIGKIVGGYGGVDGHRWAGAEMCNARCPNVHQASISCPNVACRCPRATEAYFVASARIHTFIHGKVVFTA
jgi:hypothetical protein